MNKCYDCGLSYDSPEWIETTVPNKHWLKISPTGGEGGLLCFKCMRERFKKAGMINVPCRFHYNDPEDVMLGELYLDDFDDCGKTMRRWMTQSAKHSMKRKDNENNNLL